MPWLHVKQGIDRHQTPPRSRSAARWGALYLTTLSPCMLIRPTTAKRDVIHKTGSTQRSATPPEDDQATATGVQIGPAVPEICSWTDRHTHTDRRVDHNTLHPYQVLLLFTNISWREVCTYLHSLIMRCTVNDSRHHGGHSMACGLCVTRRHILTGLWWLL